MMSGKSKTGGTNNNIAQMFKTAENKSFLPQYIQNYGSENVSSGRSSNSLRDKWAMTSYTIDDIINSSIICQVACRTEADVKRTTFDTLSEVHGNNTLEPASLVFCDYMAICQSATSVFVAFRGTKNVQDIKTDLSIRLQSQSWLPRGAKVHSGFSNRSLPYYESVEKLAKTIGKKRLILCGHSLGGALASILTLRLLMSTASRNVWTIGFGSPLICNEETHRIVSRMDLQKHFIGFVADSDLVPGLLSLCSTIANASEKAERVLGTAKLGPQIIMAVASALELSTGTMGSVAKACKVVTSGIRSAATVSAVLNNRDLLEEIPVKYSTLGFYVLLRVEGLDHLHFDIMSKPEDIDEQFSKEQNRNVEATKVADRHSMAAYLTQVNLAVSYQNALPQPDQSPFLQLNMPMNVLSIPEAKRYYYRRTMAFHPDKRRGRKHDNEYSPEEQDEAFILVSAAWSRLSQEGGLQKTRQDLLEGRFRQMEESSLKSNLSQALQVYENNFFSLKGILNTQTVDKDGLPTFAINRSFLTPSVKMGSQPSMKASAMKSGSIAAKGAKASKAASRTKSSGGIFGGSSGPNYEDSVHRNMETETGGTSSGSMKVGAVVGGAALVAGVFGAGVGYMKARKTKKEKLMQQQHVRRMGVPLLTCLAHSDEQEVPVSSLYDIMCADHLIHTPNELADITEDKDSKSEENESSKNVFLIEDDSDSSDGEHGDEYDDDEMKDDDDTLPLLKSMGLVVLDSEGRDKGQLIHDRRQRKKRRRLARRTLHVHNLTNAQIQAEMMKLTFEGTATGVFEGGIKTSAGLALAKSAGRSGIGAPLAIASMAYDLGREYLDYRTKKRKGAKEQITPAEERVMMGAFKERAGHHIVSGSISSVGAGFGSWMVTAMMATATGPAGLAAAFTCAVVGGIVGFFAGSNGYNFFFKNHRTNLKKQELELKRLRMGSRLLFSEYESGEGGYISCEDCKILLQRLFDSLQATAQAVKEQNMAKGKGEQEDLSNMSEWEAWSEDQINAAVDVMVALTIEEQKTNGESDDDIDGTIVSADAFYAWLSELAETKLNTENSESTSSNESNDDENNNDEIIPSTSDVTEEQKVNEYRKYEGVDIAMEVDDVIDMTVTVGNNKEDGKEEDMECNNFKCDDNEEEDFSDNEGKEESKFNDEYFESKHDNEGDMDSMISTHDVSMDMDMDEDFKGEIVPMEEKNLEEDEISKTDLEKYAHASEDEILGTFTQLAHPSALRNLLLLADCEHASALDDDLLRQRAHLLLAQMSSKKESEEEKILEGNEEDSEME